MSNKEQVYTTSYLRKKHTCGEFEDKKGSSLAMERGSIIHEILELGTDKYNKKGSTYRGDFRPFTFTHNFTEYEDIANMVMKKHPHLFTDLWKKEVELNAVTSKGHKVSGIVDSLCITGTSISMNDWKTGWSRANKNDELDMLQAVMYLYLAFQTYPHLTDAKFTYFYVEANEYLTVPATSKDIKKLEMQIEKFIALAQNSGLKIQSKCNYCGNMETCPLIADKLTKLESINYQDIKVMEKVLKQRKENIKDVWKEDETKIKENFSSSRAYYVKKVDLSKEQLSQLVKEDIKVPKATAFKLMDEGIEVTEKESLRVKQSAT